MYREVFAEPRAPRTVVVLPSMSLPESELAKIEGVMHYEERLLCLLMLLRLPRTQLIYVTSMALDAAVIDYYLHLLPGIPGMHARDRLELVSVADSSLTPLSAKLLANPGRLAHLKSLIRYPEAAHMTCFNTTQLEKTVAVQLGIPMYACDPDLAHLGTKSGSRSIFREAGLDLPAGYEDLKDKGDIVDALVSLHTRRQDLSQAVVKLNDGFSGEGNAVVSLDSLRDATSMKKEAERLLHEDLKFEATGEHWESFEEKFVEMGGIVEAMIEGDKKTSPSVQMRIDPLGEIQLVSTHDQVLAGPSGQVFLGCTFPAKPTYKKDLHDAGRAVAKSLRERGVMGRFGVDFVSVREEDQWRHYAIEINLRKGGTTLPYLMLEFLTDGRYDPGTGDFRIPTGDVRTYYATDNLVDEAYVGLKPADLIDAAVYQGIHFDATSQEGLVFHMLGGVTDFGKVGLLSIASDPKTSRSQYDQAIKNLRSAAGQSD